MLVFLLKAKARYTVSSYLEYWSPALKTEVAVRAYESLRVAGNLPAGTYIFCDHERWSRRERGLACELWRQLAMAGPSHVLLNDPARVLRRFELLKHLHAHGSNLFNVHRPAAALLRTRFPAFLHSTDNHEGALSSLLLDRRQLVRWLIRRVRPRRWGRLLVEEFFDVSTNDGRYAKYSSFNMGDTVVPRHVFHGHNWCLKDSEIVDAELLKAFDAYLDKNPHAGELAELFQISGIEYGRIDYALKNGRIVVWEINTNPMIIGFAPTMREEETEQTRRFNEMIQPHFLRLSRLRVDGAATAYRLRSEFRN